MSVRYKTQEVSVIDKILCDMCGTDCTKENANINAQLDKKYSVYICKKCFLDILAWMKKHRYPSIYTKENDPLNGTIKET